MHARPNSLVKLIAAMGVALGLAGTPAIAETFVIASLSDNPQREMRRYLPFKEYVEARLDGSSFTQVEVMVVPRSDVMVEAFVRERAHVYIDSPLVAMRIARASGAVPMLRRWRRGVPEFWSDFLVRRDADIQSYEDLRGTLIGFEEPESTSGHYLPRSELLAAGFDVVDLFRLDDPIAGGVVNSVFYIDDDEGLRWLLDGRISAMTVSARESAKLMEAYPQDLRVLASTMPVPRHIVLRHPGMSEADTAWFSTLLQDMDDSAEGRDVLDRWQNTVRFDPFPDGIEATFAPIHARLDLLDANGQF